MIVLLNRWNKNFGVFLEKGGRFVSLLFWITGIVTLSLLIYLFIALLRPEKFQ